MAEGLVAPAAVVVPRSRYSPLGRFGLRAIRVLVLIFFPLVTWGVAIEPRFILDVEEYTIALPHLPWTLNGTQVAAIADLQIGMWLGNTNIVRRAVDELVKRRPVAVFVAGDFIYHWTERDGDDFEAEDVVERLDAIREVAEILRPLAAAGISTFAVLGNPTTA